MTQDEIIEMARQAGFKMENSAAIQAAKAFAKLVAAKEREACSDAALKAAESSIVLAMKIEREACAQTCENLPIPNQFSESEGSVWDVAALDCAEAIRARGQA